MLNEISLFCLCKLTLTLLAAVILPHYSYLCTLAKNLGPGSVWPKQSVCSPLSHSSLLLFGLLDKGVTLER